MNGNWTLCPPRPVAILHFLGGAFVAAAPQITYQVFLNALASQGYGIIAAPFLVQPNHRAIADDVARSFNRTYQALTQAYSLPRLPVFGIGHSLGAKLQLILTCEGIVPRDGNILISFNNFDSDRAIPLSGLLTPLISLDFSPSPSEMLRQIQGQYRQHQTLLIRFQSDTLDESHHLAPIFQTKFPETFMNQTLIGDHLTPLDPDLSLTAARSKLEKVTLKWLNYQCDLLSRRRRP